MAELKNSAGHSIRVDDASVSFWEAAGYRAEPKPEPKKAPAKKSESKPDSSE